MIQFQTVKWKNFLSTGNSWTVVELDKTKTTLVVGNNGAGKSTLLDAICFGLFSKPFRKISKSNIINSVNGKDCEVQIEFSVSGKNFKIIRGIKPNTFEVYQEGILLNQESTVRDYQQQLESQILRMSYKSFTQIDILGSAVFTPFMQLPAGDRRTVIEDLLDIQVFSVMNTLTKKRISDNKEQTTSLKHIVGSKVDSIKSLSGQLKRLQASHQDKIDVIDQQLADIEKKNSKLESDIKNLKSIRTQEQKKKPSNIGKLIKKTEEMNTLFGKILNNRSTAEDSLAFYKKNTNCDSCGQPLNKDDVSSKKVDLEKKIQGYCDAIDKLQKDIEKNNKTITEANAIDASINELDRKIHGLEMQVGTNESHAGSLKSERDGYMNKNGDIPTVKKEITTAKKELKESSSKLQEVMEQKEIYDMGLTLLKDGGIKSQVISQYLPVINQKINEYLTAMEFFVLFEIDEEFNETIKSRHLDKFSYENFSEGEKMRIDLALLFTWRAVAKMRNSVHTNLLILDEVMDSSLDNEGTEEFLKIIYALEKDCNIIIISHKTDALSDKFDRTLQFEKQGNFSEMKELT